VVDDGVVDVEADGAYTGGGGHARSGTISGPQAEV
jgi:hypothetical protein